MVDNAIQWNACFFCERYPAFKQLGPDIEFLSKIAENALQRHFLLSVDIILLFKSSVWLLETSFGIVYFKRVSPEKTLVTSLVQYIFLSVIKGFK